MSLEKPASLGKDEILEILRLLDESKFDELRLEMNGLKLVLTKGAGGATQELADPLPAKATEVETTPDAPPIAELPEGPELPEGLIAVRAPILGVFYRAPAPGAPPFVQVGSLVGADDTLCLIEVMKLFNTVKAGIAGKVARILAENGKMVEQDQVLLLIEPAA
jgi:acetyl-CoA carboxylase biotin carboxyl carrier protein